MNDRSMHEAAITRQERARWRKARALEHQKQAELEAETATDPEMARRHREEATTHCRAVELHEQADAIHGAHARAHELNETDI